MFKKGLFSILFFFSIYLDAQRGDTAIQVFKEAEAELKSLLKETFYSRDEKVRQAGNKKFITAWNGIISNPKILDYPFDSLKKDVSILSPKDKKFKLITWDYHKDDGTYAYFGYLLVNNSKRIKTGWFSHETIEGYEHFFLFDNSPLIKNPESYIGTPAKWFGMLYVGLIECEGYYTLLGVDKNDNITQKKFVDVLYFKTDGTPVFGKDVFSFPKKNPRRVVFEYSSDVSMSMRWHEKSSQIVYSHLSPNKEGDVLKDQPQYYGPDFTFDALQLRKNRWYTIEDIYVENGKTRNDKKKHSDKETPILKPK
jgi:hypothetical protein